MVEYKFNERRASDSLVAVVQSSLNCLCFLIACVPPLFLLFFSMNIGKGELM